MILFSLELTALDCCKSPYLTFWACLEPRSVAVCVTGLQTYSAFTLLQVLDWPGLKQREIISIGLYCNQTIPLIPISCITSFTTRNIFKLFCIKPFLDIFTLVSSWMKLFHPAGAVLPISSAACNIAVRIGERVHMCWKPSAFFHKARGKIYCFLISRFNIFCARAI